MQYQIEWNIHMAHRDIYQIYIKASPYHQLSMFSQVLAPKLPASRLTSLLSSCAHAPAQVHVPICSMIMAA